MRTALPRLSLPPLLIGCSLLAAASTMAQVTVNPGALDLLPSAPGPETRRPAPHPLSPHPTPPRPVHAPTRPTAPTPGTATPAAAAKPVLPTVPPAIAALPPPAPVPPARPQPVPIVPVSADAPGTASPLPNGLRVTFGAERQDLNPTTEAALRSLAQRLRTDQATINIYAYAQGKPDDPSTARRLSLGRALAARAVLITEGVASNRIYPRSLGPSAGDADKDRVDVVVAAPGAPLPIAAPGAPLPVAAPGAPLPIAAPGAPLPIAAPGTPTSVASP